MPTGSAQARAFTSGCSWNPNPAGTSTGATPARRGSPLRCLRTARRFCGGRVALADPGGVRAARWHHRLRIRRPGGAGRGRDCARPASPVFGAGHPHRLLARLQGCLRSRFGEARGRAAAQGRRTRSLEGGPRRRGPRRFRSGSNPVSSTSRSPVVRFPRAGAVGMVAWLNWKAAPGSVEFFPDPGPGLKVEGVRVQTRGQLTRIDFSVSRLKSSSDPGDDAAVAHRDRR